MDGALVSTHRILSQHRVISSLATPTERGYSPITGALPGGIVGSLLTAYLVYAVLFATLPYSFSVDASDSITTLFNDKFDGLGGLSRVSPWDVWTNILFFVPFGLLLVSHPLIFHRAWQTKLLLATGGSALLSSGIEFIQLFFPRAPSLEDIVCNTIGGLIGGVIGICVQAMVKLDGAARLRNMQPSTALAILTAGYLMFLSATVSMPLPLARDLSNWDQTHRLFLGNEGSLDRPWRGTMYLVAVYDHALSPEEVMANFSAGYRGGARDKRADHGLLLYYDFSEQTGDIIHDQAKVMPAVDLQIEDPSRVEWIMPNGIRFGADTVVSSPEPPAKLAPGMLQPGNELTVEAWIAPADLSQTGPARIVSYSINADGRNFTLGQHQSEMIFRLRTPVSGLNGTQPALRTDAFPLTLDIGHYLVTFRDGVETLYVNGKAHTSVLLRSHESLSDRIIQSAGKRFKWLIYSMLVFPLGILTVLLFRQLNLSWIRLVSIATAVVVLSMIQVLRPLMVGESFEPSFLVVSVITVLTAVLLLPRSIPRYR